MPGWGGGFSPKFSNSLEIAYKSICIPTETALLNKDLLEVLPGVEEANAISEELDKKTKFEIMLLSPQWLGKTSGRTEVSDILFPSLFN